MEQQNDSINFNEIHKRLAQIERVLQRPKNVENNNNNNNTLQSSSNETTKLQTTDSTTQQTDPAHRPDSSNNENKENKEEKEEEKPLLYYLDKLEKEFDRIKSVQLNSFFQRLNKYGLSMNIDDAIYDLDLNDKLSMIIDREPEVISKAARLAQILENHLQYLQYPYLTKIHEDRTRLNPLEELNAEQVQKAISLSSQITSLLYHYNEIIHTLSHKFVLWNKNLSELEERVDTLLLKKGLS